MEALPSTLAQAVCAYAFSCCDATDNTWLFRKLDPAPSTQAQCEATLTAVFQVEINDPHEHFGDGRMIYDPEAASGCVATVQAATTSCSGFAFDMLNDAPSCAAMFAGAVATGDVCESRFECALAGSSCGAFDQSGVGTCVAPAELGESCVEAACEAGLFCSPGAGSASCVALLADGNSCMSHEECAGGYCDPATGACGPRGPLGGACTGWLDCAEGTCDATTQTCAPPLPDGADCSASQECQSGDCQGSCDPPRCEGP